MPRTPALLVLADGAAFPGFLIGAESEAGGEVVFNTAQTGYQEILTDPASAGQLVNFTFPQLGNYGTTPEDDESAGPRAAGLIAAELGEARGHFRSRKNLEPWLAEHGLTGLSGADTRALTRHLRLFGSQNGCIGPLSLGRETLLAQARSLPAPEGRNLAEAAACREPYSHAEGPRGTIAVLDLGAARSSLDQLALAGFGVRAWPYGVRAETILASGAAGVFLSSGPGDPAALDAAIETTRNILGRRPIFGLGLGHQVLALALGGRTFRLSSGHRGANHPVREEKTGRVIITSQNHGFFVDPAGLPRGAVVTHLNVRDRTVEGLAAPEAAAFSVQYRPDPSGARALFDEFGKMIDAFPKRP